MGSRLGFVALLVACGARTELGESAEPGAPCDACIEDGGHGDGSRGLDAGRDVDADAGAGDSALDDAGPDADAAEPDGGVVMSISAGGDHNCALLSSGAIRCWGSNSLGELGDGTTISSSAAVGVVGLGPAAISVSAGGGNTCAVLSTGALVCWGQGGQVGDGTTTQRDSPVPVLGGVGSVAAGDAHTALILSSGAVRTWGFNSNGQLGDGTTITRISAVDVMSLGGSAVSASASGEEHTCALLSTGTIRCWGTNYDGQLGDGTTTDRLTPVDVVGLGGTPTALALGEGHTCALLTSGAIQCWGDGGSGQVGDGSNTFVHTSPVNVVSLGGSAIALATGLQHGCALFSSGKIRCWGDNSYGQLGDGTKTQRTSPVDVLSLGGSAAAIAAGGSSTCALLTSGAVQCWGAAVGTMPVTVKGLP